MARACISELLIPVTTPESDCPLMSVSGDRGLCQVTDDGASVTSPELCQCQVTQVTLRGTVVASAVPVELCRWHGVGLWFGSVPASSGGLNSPGNDSRSC